MGIFGAMTTAISGLTAQSFALENISGNIANSRTTGFKRVDTSFADLVPDLPPKRERSGSVGAFSRNTATVEGDIQASQIGTHIAVSGEGFFAVRKPTGDVAGDPIFAGEELYTRRGDFELDRNGYLVNGTGNYLMGFPVNPITGAVLGTAMQVLRISPNNLPARATSEIEYNVNLPKYPLTNNASPTVPGSELLTGPLFTGPTIAAVNENGFLDRTIAGQSVTVYDAAGSPVNVQIRWGKTTNASPETWSAYYLSDSTATGPAPKWTQISNTVQFNASGQLTNPATGIIPAFAFTVDGVTTPAIDINFGTIGLTQFADPNGQLVPNRISQDGYPTGTFQRVQVGEGGRVMGSYSNGQTVPLAQIPLVQFPADNLLKRGDGGIFEQTLESGEPLIVNSGGNILGGSLENSNSDIADEFSKMIITQQAYSANTRVVSTAQTMLQDVINIIR
ncbi:MAG: flagellar hook protein FlgE [Methylobacterium sp.]|nr:flagellar hook protein FlgE [Methylobacterium sp.]MCA3650105.1 flagellar hook protein FlgE [Methylobacterium sp.]MCA3650667.1 flagellar hook protein FlgE [Methylobacterium sp.]MCA3654569.1 flagellar hook protein FlgE [Methylobacterium sp.]MCA3656942.1 flagellar hook protein FlgE [Methylobacterium sp.]